MEVYLEHYIFMRKLKTVHFWLILSVKNMIWSLSILYLYRHIRRFIHVQNLTVVRKENGKLYLTYLLTNLPFIDIILVIKRR